MSADDLARRLAYLREEKREGPRSTGTRGPAAAAPLIGTDGWRQEGPYLLVKESERPLVYPPLFPAGPLFPRDTDASSLLFFDTETTGLSGGAGTVAFLLGVGRLAEGRFRAVQLFLSDYPGEPDFLSRAAEYFTPDKICVSYNGRAFDSHLLRSRFIMNRIPFAFPPQSDLLYPARRLWKSILESCSLSSIEEHVLSVRREGDIPGSMVPELYFRFLRDRDFDALSPVFSHNLQDVLSLAMLTVRMDSIFADPLSCTGMDRLSLALLLLSSRDPKGEGGLLLQRLASEGDVRAALTLAGFRKRRGLWTEAVSLWEMLWEKDSNGEAGLELAKYYEHRAKDFTRAESLVETLLAKAPPAGIERVRLLHRLNRLRSKIGPR